MKKIAGVLTPISVSNCLSESNLIPNACYETGFSQCLADYLIYILMNINRNISSKGRRSRRKIRRVYLQNYSNFNCYLHL